jgi:hypothetical protein
MTSSASNNWFFGSNLHPKKKLLDSLVPKPLRGQKLEPISARKKQTNNGLQQIFFSELKVNSPNYWQIRIVKARKKPQRGK